MKRNHTLALVGSVALATVAAGALSSADAALPRTKNNPVRVSVEWLGQDKVAVTVANASRKTLRIPKWQLPAMASESELFQISRDGQPVQYTGMLAKRGVPTASDFAIIRPGARLRTEVSLGQSYDLSKPGFYTIAYAALTQYASLSGGEQLRQANGAPMVTKAAPIRIALASGIVAGGRVHPVLPANPVLSDVLGITTVSCSSSQIDQINQAILTARTYTENAKGYLNAGTTGARYTHWFGAYTSSRYATVKQHFATIDTAMDQTGGQVKVNCACTGSEYAHVFKNDAYQIYVCNAFWPAPAVGTDSKPGTLIHEMSHFTVVADTDDWAYGQTAAGNLANSNPDQAIDNADSHEYFAENTPLQN